MDAFERGDLSTALVILDKLVQREPNLAAAHNLIGLCYLKRNQFPSAERALLRAVSIEENEAFYTNLGLIYLCGGNLERAADAYKSSLRLDPTSAEVCSNLANLLCTFGQQEEAILYLAQAVRYHPNVASWQFRLGTHLFSLSRFAEAEHHFRLAINIDGSASEPRRRLADLLVETGRFDEAFKHYEAIGAWGWQQFAMRSNVSWNNVAETDLALINELKVGAASPVSPWCLLNIPDLTPALEKRAAYAFAVHAVPELNIPPMPISKSAPLPTERLRIGYLSSDFNNHATAYLMAGVVEAHNRNEHDIVLFSYGKQNDDECSRRLRGAGWPVIDLSNTPNNKAAEEIAKHRIDILVEMKGHTGGARLGISAFRPAPIIVSWLGHPGTLGHERLADYIIGDHIVTPPEDAQFFSERLALMPNCYQPNDFTRPLPTAPERALVGLPEDQLVFCSFNQPAKFNPRTFDLWGKLLAENPESVLWLLQSKHGSTSLNILREFESRSIDPRRIIFAPHVSQHEHIARLRLADIALDTFPCTSHTTASDALWAGVPLVTLKGSAFAGRVAASILTTFGFPELIANNEEEYFNLADELASDRTRLSELRQRIDRARSVSPLFDTVRFIRDLEKLFRCIVRDHNQPMHDQRFVSIR
ncbi:MAG: tetratricopeptide repeat protein [Mesorhizobium sp.]